MFRRAAILHALVIELDTNLGFIDTTLSLLAWVIFARENIGFAYSAFVVIPKRAPVAIRVILLDANLYQPWLSLIKGASSARTTISISFAVECIAWWSGDGQYRG